MAAQSTLDLPKLETKATDLHLIVRSSQILQVPVRSIPSHIPRTVHPRTRCTIWTRNKTLRRQSTTLQIAPCQPRSRDIQLPGYPYRNRAQSPVQHIYLRVPDRPTDQGQGFGCIHRTRPRSHIDRRFRRSVEVVKFCVAELLPNSPRKLPRQRLSAADHAQQARTHSSTS